MSLAGLHKLANTTGLSLLDWTSDVLVLFLCAIAFVTVFVTISSVIRRRLPTLLECANGLAAFGSLVGAIQIVCVMVLTQPPAIDKLGAFDRAFVCLFSTAVVTVVAIYGLYLVFFKKP